MITSQSIEFKQPQVKSSPVVIHVINGMGFGGTENICLQVMKHAPPNVQNILLNLNPEQQEMGVLFQKIPNLRIIELAYKSDRRWNFILNLARQLREIKPQAILIYVFGVHIFVGLAARIAGVPTIAARAGNPPPKDKSAQKQWQKITFFSRLLRIPIYYCTESVGREFQAFTKAPQGSQTLVNGCDISGIYQRATQTRLTRSVSSSKIIGMVARLNEIKDHQTLIRAFQLLCNSYPETQLWLVGDGEKRADLEKLVANLNLQDQVIFWGGRPDIPEMLGQMDIYAFSTTNEEGYGNAVIEAAAAGLPIVASDVSGCREVLGQGQAGILVPPGDAAALAKVLEDFLASDAKRIDWGKRAYQYALANHDIQQCADKWYAILLNN